ncbi:EAL domain protein, partial [Vibrio harveyi]
SFSI